MKKKLLIAIGAVIIIVVIAVVARIPACNPEIRDWHDLHAIRYHLGKSYILMNDLDATTAGYEELAGPRANDGKGWQPIGTRGNPFTGVFDGQGYEISDLFIHRPDENRVGLFGNVGEGGVIGSVGAVNATVIGNDDVGGLVGANNRGTVTNSYSASTVTGQRQVGGLVGGNHWGSLSDSHATGSVIGSFSVGGLVGHNWGPVSNSYSATTVSGNVAVGGLVGRNYEGPVSNSYAAGSVTGDDYVGGLVGSNEGKVLECYSTGSVSGQKNVGGLVGKNEGQIPVPDLVADVTDAGSPAGQGFPLTAALTPPLIPPDGVVRNSYSSGKVSGNEYVGGLVGSNRALVSNCYATGSVTRSSGENTDFGGFVGYNHQGKIINCYSTGSVHCEGVADPTDKGFAGSVNTGGNYEMTGSFWDTEASGQTSTAGDAAGKTTAEMMDIATFTDTETEGLDEPWDIIAVAPGETDPAYTWNIVDGETYPFVSWQSAF